MKTYISFRLDRQRWTRQDIGPVEDPHPQREWRQRIVSGAMHGVALGYLVLAIGILTNALAMPDRMSVQSLLELVARNDPGSSFAIRTAINSAEKARVVSLPEDPVSSAPALGMCRDVTLTGYRRGRAAPTPVVRDAAWSRSLDAAGGPHRERPAATRPVCDALLLQRARGAEDPGAAQIEITG